MNWLARTKISPPLLREDVIPRRHLLDDLHSRLTSHPLTLLSAPAGYGKTTVLAALPQTYPDLAVAWLSLDEEDNDPARFLAALVASLRRLNPECGATALSLLADLSGAGLEARRVMSVLINDIQDALPDPFAMLLDDLHLIVEPSIYVALRYLLERIPPQMRLVAASRTDPPLALARMRARGEVAELHLVDLRFSSAETKTFLNDSLGLNLAPDDLDSLHSRTEGWPAGLRLLAGSLGRIRASEDRNAFIRHFTQSKRYVFDFLAEEVLNHQEPDLRAFLLQTAILPELTPSLCLAVTGRADAQTVLDELSRRNLIMVVPGQDPLRAAGRDSSHAVTPPEPSPSFRYHALFAEFLRQRLQQEMPERVNRLHVLAARAERVRSRSIGHYLAAAKWHEAATVIEQVGHDALRQGLLDTLAGWINTLPAEILDAHPILLHYLGICAWQRGRLVAAQPLLERAQAGYERADMGAERSEATADLATCALLLADFAKSESLYDRALTDATPPQTRLRVLMDRSWIGILQGRWGQAQQDFDNAMAMTQGPLDPDVLKSLVYHLGPGLVVLPGGIDHIERICHLALAQVGEQISPMRAQIEGLMALIHGWRGRWLKALELGRQVVAIEKRLGGQPFIGHDAAAVVIAACGAIGNYALADAYFDLLFQGVRHMEFADLYVSAFLFVPGRVLWMQGRFAEAERVYQQMRDAKNPRELPLAQVVRAWMRALLDAEAGKAAQAERALRQPFVLEQTDRISSAWGSTRLILARLYLTQGRQQEALRELDIVLPRYERMGMLGGVAIEGATIVPLLKLAVEKRVQALFATRLLELLRAGTPPQPIEVPATGQALTRREVEVLRLISVGASNQDIADRLVISMSTVKAHVSHILAKLDVSNRTQAASRAREWRLLSYSDPEEIDPA